jgi:hypothetical protein
MILAECVHLFLDACIELSGVTDRKRVQLYEALHHHHTVERCNTLALKNLSQSNENGLPQLIA